MTYTTLEALRLAEEAFMKIADLRNLGKINPEVIAFETLYTIRAARAQEQAEQEPIGMIIGGRLESLVDEYETGAWPIYAAPVRTKDLTDDEIMKINVDTASIVPTCDRQFHFARAVIAADREKNK